MKRILLIIFILAISFNLQAFASEPDFNSVINDSGIDVESISISIKNLKTKKTVYSLNDKMLMTPASVQKILTTPVSVETLGLDYQFETSLYSNGSNSYIVKLGADPYLKSSDLKELIKPLTIDTKKMYIDSTILDNKIWGEGWQWDDDMNILMPKFSSYNLDKNLIKLTVLPAENGKVATILNPSKYPIVFFNNIVNGEHTKIDVKRDNSISENSLVLNGTVARPTIITIPTNNLKRYFDIQLSQALENKKIYLKEYGLPSKVSKDDVFLNKITHDINTAITDILKNSNNLVSETLFKLAGRKYCNLETGSDISGIKMFNDYCKRNNLDNTKIKITDASGVSKNNLVSTDFITDFLILNKDNPVLKNLPSPGEGTLTHRMLTIKDNLSAKTGTLSDVSSIAGFLTAKSGKQYTFCIISNDIQLSNSDKKMLEDYIIREAYLRL